MIFEIWSFKYIWNIFQISYFKYHISNVIFQNIVAFLHFLLQLYQAIYSFSSRNELELSIEEGQLYRVLQTHDLDQNPDWWLVLNTGGKQGYVPANYIYKTSWQD